MRVLGLTKYGSQAASTRQRFVQYEPYLKLNGVELEIRALLDNSYIERLAHGEKQSGAAISLAYIKRVRDLFTAGNFDVLWIQYEAFPYLPGLVERALLLTGVPIVYDIDDAIFHQYDQHVSTAVRKALGRKLVPLLREASACLCGNAYLQAYTSEHCSNSLIVPTVVDSDVFVPANLITPKARPGPTSVLGWIGSPSTWRFVEPMLPTILPVLARHGAIFQVVGAGPRAWGIAGVVCKDWAEAREVEDIQEMDIGIMPLPDDLWAKGKCGYKLIQYMACGLPTIASPVGVNNQIVAHGEDGFLATSREEWVAAIDMLIGDAAIRRTMGRRGRDKVVSQYSLASQQDTVLNALRSAADSRPSSRRPA